MKHAKYLLPFYSSQTPHILYLRPTNEFMSHFNVYNQINNVDISTGTVAQKSPVSKRVQCSPTERYIKTGLFWATVILVLLMPCDQALKSAMLGDKIIVCCDFLLLYFLVPS